MMEVIIPKDFFLQTWVGPITQVRDLRVLLATCYQPEDMMTYICEVMTEATSNRLFKTEEGDALCCLSCLPIKVFRCGGTVL